MLVECGGSGAMAARRRAKAKVGSSTLLSRLCEALCRVLLWHSATDCDLDGVLMSLKTWGCETPGRRLPESAKDTSPPG
jgi:hypothetical protein